MRILKKLLFICLFNLNLCSLYAQSFTMEEVGSFPFVTGLTAAGTGSKIGFTVNEKGKRNIYVADGPAFSLRKLTSYNIDEGLELTSLSISADGKWVVFVRGGDHGAYDETLVRNPSSAPLEAKIQVFCVPFEGGTPTLISDGDNPVFSPDSKQVVFTKNSQVWVSTLSGKPRVRKMFNVKGSVSSVQWSPDGSRLAFVADRDDHALVGIFKDSLTAIKWLSPDFSRDQSPQWSPDGKEITFIRRPARGGKTDSLTTDVIQPWAIWKANTSTGVGTELWKAPYSRRGSLPETNGGTNLHWAANHRITYVSYEDGWPHLYSLPDSGGKPMLLTPGNFIVEHIKLSPDKRWLLFSTNAGKEKEDKDRRHLGRVPVDRVSMELLTTGTGLESNPVVLGAGEEIAALFASAKQPNIPGILNPDTKKIRVIGQDLIPPAFPADKLITPTSVTFKAADGSTVYGQLFEPQSGGLKKPAIVFVHGGPERQMLLGWNYGDYYSNTYALNQYLAAKGFVVLAVNYRLGIGYGFDFQHPKQAWTSGASEYQDIQAAGKWLSQHVGVDSKRIGIYGGSYGGYLTAMALAKDSKIFAAGVDIHGEHNLMVFAPKEQAEPAPDLALAKQLMWKSSPVAWLDSWTSPVLIIHGDDDGNVVFHQSIDLINRLRAQGKAPETMMVPDETHHWMRFENMIKVDQATADFLIRKLK
jgi:dipeptidyl aminopeptidase/acylaminoacyl peptidase